MNPADEDGVLATLCAHLAILSLMAVGGGVIMLAPDIHRLVTITNHWITDEQFAAAYAIAQAAPGPNMLYVTIVGWQVGGLAGAVGATLAIIVPPVVLTLILLRAGSTRAPGRLQRSLRFGLAPLSVGLLLAGGWVLFRTIGPSIPGALVTLGCLVVSVRTKINPLWLIGAGAALGVTGWV